MQTPCYAAVPGGVIVQADACASVARVSDNTGGRILTPSIRKVEVLLLLEGPTRTWSKVRAKLEQRRYLGQWHVTLVQGRRQADGAPVLALAPCAPAAASHFLVPDALVRPLDRVLERSAFAAIADALRSQAATLALHGHERYLYSGNPVPPDLLECFDGALLHVRAGLRVAGTGGLASGRARTGDAATVLSIRRRPGGAVRTLPLALLGAGDYARIEILPALARRRSVTPFAVADREPQIAVGAARRGGFRLATTNPREATDALPSPGVVMVATAHDSHADLAAYAARAGHAVFVEKPPVVTHGDLTLLVDASLEAPGRIEIGFNRRQAPLMRHVRAALARARGPITIACTVREVPLRDTHWFLWPNQGTRVAGNLCHWIDLGVHLVGRAGDPTEVRISPPLVSDRAMPSGEERSLSVAFSDGSLLTILSTVRGDDVRGVQESIEIRRGGITLTLDDLRTLSTLAAGRRRVRRGLTRDKGHSAMYAGWAARLGSPAPATYPLRDLVTVGVLQLAATGLVQTDGDRCEVIEQLETWRSYCQRARDPVPW